MLYQNKKEWMKNSRSAFYLFDIDKLKERIACIKEQLPDDVLLCYAVKANPFVIKEVENCLDRFELCSPGEADICADLHIESRKMVISGVYKTPHIMEKMVADLNFNGIFTAESLQQYKLLCDLSEKYTRNIRVLLRLTNDSQFGMNKSDIQEIIENRSCHPFVHISGIQFFSGTQKTSIRKYKREIEYLDEFLTVLNEQYHYEAEELEYGPGFPVAYFVSDEIDERQLFDSFSQLLHAMRNKPQITLELGRSIAASCGQYFTHIVDIKQNANQNYALVDGGMHQIVYFGQHMAMKHPILSVVGKENLPKLSAWTICGSLCSMNDILAKQILLPDIEIGDTICFENAGAYCMCEGISLFLSREIPAIYLQSKQDGIRCVRQTFEMKNLNTPHYERMD